MSIDSGLEQRQYSTRTRWLSYASLLFAMLILLWSCHEVQQSTSVTFDETFYLNCGLRSVASGMVDPMLPAEGVAPLPVILTYVPGLIFQPHDYRPEVWYGQPTDKDLIHWPRRLNTILIGWPLLVLVFAWLFRERGPWIASCGVLLTALSPTINAHAALATTDVGFAVFALLAIFSLAHYLKSPTWGRFLILAVAVSACLSAKYSGVFILPVIGLMFFQQSIQRRPESTTESLESTSVVRQETLFSQCLRGLKGSIPRYLLLLAIILPLWWAMHGFTFSGPLKNVPLAETPNDSPWVEILGRGPWADWFMDQAHRHWKRPSPVGGVLFQYLHNKGGHFSFLMGRTSLTGWRIYFPCTLAFKSTPAELILGLGLVLFSLAALRHPVRAWKNAGVDRQCLMLSLFVICGLLLSARINIGHRYILILYPILLLLGLDAYGRIAESLWKRGVHFTLLAIPLVLLIGSQLYSHEAIRPHYLSYFNQLSGGPKNGWKLLVDSNIDWGQDLPALRGELERLKPAKPAIQYFGTAIPSAYGVPGDLTTALTSAPEDYDLLAISVTHLQGLYLPGNDPYWAFREWEPDGRIGYSIFLYRLDTPERKAAFRKAINVMNTARQRSK
ncbi:MAG: hypothetical protein C0478_03590 [Planctomyces sp.]|nr:hypothetical protein [Planctomyces sp.]